MATSTSTAPLLYRYLRLLHVQTDRSTVARLLDHPLGNSLRGVSDALDALGVKNGAYRLPPEYFGQLEAPFIALTRHREDPFCLVERTEGTMLTVYTQGRSRQMEQEAFARLWTGDVLLGEGTESARRTPWRWLNNAGYALQRHCLSLAGGLAAALLLWQTGGSPRTALLAVLAAGIATSAAILYKERVNSRFLQRFCHIGQAVDCNAVLRSRGARLAGAGLGEWSLFYFLTLLLLVLAAPRGFFPLAALCGAGALGFTAYSVVYQLFIIRKGCMLCMVINLLVWLNCLLLYLLWQAGVEILPTWQAGAALTLSAGIGLCTVLLVRKQTRSGKERREWQARFAGLLTPQAFRALLALSPRVGCLPGREYCLHNGRESKGGVLVVTNPTCRNCTRIHPHLRELAAHVPISLLLLTSPRDVVGQEVALRLIAAWQAEGWERMLHLLEAWNQSHDLHSLEAYPVTEAAKTLHQKQLEYAAAEQISRTPLLLVEGAYVPEVYGVEDLRFVYE